MGAQDGGGQQSRFQGYRSWPEVLAPREIFRAGSSNTHSVASVWFRRIGDLERKATLVASAKKQIMHKIGML
jgi:hypothetical protein